MTKTYMTSKTGLKRLYGAKGEHPDFDRELWAAQKFPAGVYDDYWQWVLDGVLDDERDALEEEARRRMDETCSDAPDDERKRLMKHKRLMNRIAKARDALWGMPPAERPTSEEQVAYVRALEALYREVAK